MTKFKKLNLEILDNKLKSYHFAESPKNGWIKTIRSAVSMPLSYLARAIGVTTQALSGLEKSEADETISIGKLRQVAEAMGCKLYYVIIPEEKSLKKMVYKQAYKKASAIVNEVDKSMILEDQKVNEKNKSTEILAKELAENPNFKLWEAND